MNKKIEKTENQQKKWELKQKYTKQFDGKVLIVEDNITNQIVAKNMLELFVLDIEIAGNGLEALSKLKENDYDIVFMDCHMPYLDGYIANRKIRD